MTIVSPERENMVGLVVSAHEHGLQSRERFDPTEITGLADQAGAEVAPIFFRQTDYLATMSGIGRQIVAKFTEEGPATSRAESEDVVHHTVDQAILARRPNESEIRTLPSAIKPNLAWVLELIVPDLERPGTALRTGLKTKPFVSTVG